MPCFIHIDNQLVKLHSNASKFETKVFWFLWKRKKNIYIKWLPSLEGLLCALSEKGQGVRDKRLFLSSDFKHFTRVQDNHPGSTRPAYARIRKNTKKNIYIYIKRGSTWRRVPRLDPWTDPGPGLQVQEPISRVSGNSGVRPNLWLFPQTLALLNCWTGRD